MIIFTLDVLALPGDGIGQRQPSPEGRRLWHLFFSKHSGAIVLVADRRDDRDHLEHWLKVEGFKPTLIDFAEDTSARAKYERASALRASLGGLAFLVDVDPRTALLALEEGIPTLLAITPHVARPDWRTRQRVGWDALVNRIDDERAKAAERTWGDTDDD